MNSTIIKLVKTIVPLALIRVVLCSVLLLSVAGWAQAKGISTSTETANVGDQNVTLNSVKDDWGNEWPDDGLWLKPDGPTHQVDNPLGAIFKFSGFGRSNTTAFGVRMRTKIPGENWSGFREEILSAENIGLNIFEVGVQESKGWSPGTIVELQYKPREGNSVAKNWTEPKQFRMSAKPKPAVWRYPANNTDHIRPDNLFQIGANSSSAAGEAIATGANAGVDGVMVLTNRNGQPAVQQNQHIAPLSVGGAFTVDIIDSNNWKPGDTVDVTMYVRRDGIFSDASITRTFHMTYPAPSKVDWVSPANGSQYILVQDNPLHISGKTDTGVDQVSVWWKELGTDGTGSYEPAVGTALDSSNNFDVQIAGSVNWKADSTYEVQFKVHSGKFSSGWSAVRQIYVQYPAPTRLDWISPASGSDYVPVQGNPLHISGKTDKRVDAVSVGWRETGTESFYEPVVGTVLDRNNNFDVPIAGSVNWKANTTYEVLFKVHAGKLESGWSEVRHINIPPPAPTRVEWVSPAADSLFNTLVGKPLTISGKTDPGVNQINIAWCKESHLVCGQTLFQDIPVVGSDGIFSNVPLPDSLNWDPGLPYMLKFYAKRDGVSSLVSVERRVLTARPVPKIVEWITPPANYVYRPSVGNPLRISAVTETGVTQVNVFSKRQGSNDSTGVSKTFDVKLDYNYFFENIPIEDSVNWKQKNSYQVRIAVIRDGLSSEPIIRNFNVPYEAKRLDWINPMTVESLYAPGEGKSLRISGQTDPDVTHVIVRSKLKGGTYGPESITKVVLNGESIFENVEILDSPNWKIGQSYELQYRVRADFLTSANWSPSRFIHVIPPQPVWVSPGIDSWLSPSSDNLLIISGKTLPGVNQMNARWCTEDHKICGWTEDQDIATVGEDGIFRFPLIDSKNWQNGRKYDVNFRIKHGGVESLASVERRFQVDTVAPEITLLQQSMSDEGNYVLGGTVTDKASGLGVNGDGKKALTIRWRSDSKQKWSNPISADVLSSNTFVFGLTATQLDKNWTVEVEISATDRAGNINKQQVFFAEPAVIRLDVTRTNWESATIDGHRTRDEREQSNPLATSASKGSRPIASAGSEMFAGDTFSYSVTVTGEKGKATSLNINYTLPDELERNGVPVLTLSKPGSVTLNPNWDGTKNQSDMLAEGAHLNTKETLNISVPVRIKWDAVKAPESHIGVTADGIEDPGYTDVVVLVPYQGELKLVKRVDKESANEGDTLAYTIKFSNTSNTFIVMEEIRDPIDPRMTLEDLSCGDDIPADITCAVTASDTAAIWEFTGYLPSGVSGSVGYRATITKPK